MSVRGRVAIADPENVDVSLQITMTTKEWREVMKQLEGAQNYEASRIYWLIFKTVSKATSILAETIEGAEEIR